MTSEPTEMKLLDLPDLPAMQEYEPAAERLLPVAGRLPLTMLAGIGERLATCVAELQRAPADEQAGARALARLEAWGVQMQEIAHIVTNAAQLRHERLDLGLALLQTLAEWSGEAARRGAELHGPATSVEVDCNPAALKHLLDLLVEHGLARGQALRFDVDAPDGAPFVAVILNADSAAALPPPAGDQLAWQMLVLLARALHLVPERELAADGERIVLPLPRG